jgi:hypothetical protein
LIKNLGIKILIAIVFGILIQTVLDFNPCLIIAIGLMSFMLSIWERRFLFGVVAALSAINVYLNAPVQLPHEGRDLVFSGIVVGEDHHENYTKLSINIDEALLKKDTINYKINVHFYTRNQETFLGRRLFIKGRIRPAKFLHQPNILSGKIIKTGSAGNLFDRISYAVRKRFKGCL